MFQTDPPVGGHVPSLDDVLDALRATEERRYPVGEREAYFSARGMDYERVRTYYSAVRALELAYSRRAARPSRPAACPPLLRRPERRAPQRPGAAHAPGLVQLALLLEVAAWLGALAFGR